MELIKEKSFLENVIEEHFKNKSDEEIEKYLKIALDTLKLIDKNIITMNAMIYLTNPKLKLKYTSMYDLEAFCIHSLTLFDNDDDKIAAYRSFKIKIDLIFLFNVLNNKKRIIELLQDSYVFEESTNNQPSENITLSSEIPKEMTFGIELEAENGNSKVIRFLNKTLFNRWTIKSDPSLINNALEINSPIIHYSQKDLQELYQVCKFMKDNGLEATANCACHIHIGADFFKTKKEWLIFFYLFTACEEIVYLLSNAENSLPRKRSDYYAQYLTDEFLEAIEDGILTIDDSESYNEFLENLKESIQPSTFRNKSVNILNTNTQNKNTIEFRMANGTLDFDIIHQNLKLFALILVFTQKLSSDYDKGLNYVDKLLSLEINERAKYFINSLFTDEKDKEYFLQRWNANYQMQKEKSELKI